MKTYIEREYVLGLINRHLSNSCGAEYYAYNTLKKELEDALSENSKNSITNYEKIKSMSIEELAFLLDGFSACSYCRKNGNNCFPSIDFEIWLKQEAKE